MWLGKPSPYVISENPMRHVTAPHVRRLVSIGGLTLATVATAACTPRQSETESAPTPATSTADAPAASGAAAPRVTDPQIAAIVVAANTVDVRAGELALGKASNPEVRAFAQRMVTDHNGVNKAAVALVTRLGVTPVESPTSTGLTASGDSTRARLTTLSGAAFDRAYIANEVAYHQTVISALDGVLVPSAQNAELKSTLVSVRPAFVAHLEHARQLQAKLGGGQ